MGPQVPDEPFGSPFNDPDLGAVFARSSPADTFAAVLTEARLVLAEVENPLDAELGGSGIVAALGPAGDQTDELAGDQADELAGDQGGDQAADLADAIVSAAEGAATPAALATLIVLGAVGSGPLGEAARAAAGRLAEAGDRRPAGAEGSRG